MILMIRAPWMQPQAKQAPVVPFHKAVLRSARISTESYSDLLIFQARLLFGLDTCYNAAVPAGRHSMKGITNDRAQ